jgi:hypothetical protein
MSDDKKFLLIDVAWIKSLADFRDEKKLHQGGSVLMLPENAWVGPEAERYAKERNIEIVYEKEGATLKASNNIKMKLECLYDKNVLVS